MSRMSLAFAYHWQWHVHPGWASRTPRVVPLRILKKLAIIKMYSKDTNQCCLHLMQLDTPIGPIKVTGCEKGIHEIKLTPSDTTPCGKIGKVTLVGEERKSELPGSLHECVSWLEMFFKDAGSIVDIPLPPLHTSIKPDSFVAKVLHSLTELVPPGKTISYKDLAAEMGNPRAARAVGMAMAVNPVPLLLPCHRVIKSDGTFRKYIAGLPVKKWLLEHEGAKLDTFISNVLDTLAHDIPVGETISYGGLAAKVGKPSACRAVGMAMRMNQVPLIVPCHRVVNSDGSLGNYMSGRGVALKQWLLNHEGALLKD